MLLTIETTHEPATDLGFLLHKHPNRFQSFDLSFGRAHVFYPQADETQCVVCLLLDVDPVGMVRGRNRNSPGNFLLGHYVNDRPYVASSFMSVAISQVFGTALGGRCQKRPELVSTPIPLIARIDVLPVRGGAEILPRIFDPLGYAVEATRHPLDERFPEWGESSYFSVTISGTKTLSDLLTHLYVLIPVFDNNKHYFVGEDEIEKLLAKGGGLNDEGRTGWLADHPEKEFIVRRYLKHRTSLTNSALDRLREESDSSISSEDEFSDPVDILPTLSLNERRLGAVMAALRASGAQSVLDLGCGEGKLLRQLFDDKQFTKVVGMDVSVQSLQRAVKRLGYDQLPPKQRERIELIHGSLMYRDRRLAGFDAAAIVEVIEHLDPPRLTALQRVVFEFARPKAIVMTTPNREYNVMWETLPASQFRHSDHRFEWTREEFQDWANRVAQQHGYSVRFLPIGSEEEGVGSPTQMGVFSRE